MNRRAWRAELLLEQFGPRATPIPPQPAEVDTTDTIIQRRRDLCMAVDGYYLDSVGTAPAPDEAVVIELPTRRTA